MLTKLFRTELFHNLDYKSGCEFQPVLSGCDMPLICGTSNMDNLPLSAADGAERRGGIP
jgi:hypothetical protein